MNKQLVLFAFALAFLLVGVSVATTVSCSDRLQPVFNAAQGYQCITASGTGLTADGTQVGFKGSFMFNRFYNAIRQQTATAFIKSSDYICNPHNSKFQPFLADSAITYSQFNIYANGSVQLGNDVVPLVCIQESPNTYIFSYQGVVYQFNLIINSITVGCPALHFGESCTASSTTSSPPANPTTSTTGPSTTGSSTTGSGQQAKVTFTSTVANTWNSGNDKFTQYNVDIKNVGTAEITSLVFSATNFNPSEKWNIESLPNGDLTLPSYGNIAVGGTYTFGYITASSGTATFKSK